MLRGLVNKAWALGTSTSDARPFYWLESTIRHGVTSDTFHDSTTAQWTHTSKSYSATQNMDGFAKDGHVALIYVEGSSNNTDQMVEAYDERDGTWIHSESYRGSSSYVGLARNNWTPECYPSCSP